MGAADRTVQHLHLRAPSAQAAVHAVHRLEDAMRCASLPDTGERLLLVRRLHLGRLPEGLSSQSLSLLIEQRVAAMGGEWVRGDDERAARSDTACFASRLEAAQAALHRRAMGLALDAWYWPLALPGVALQASAAIFAGHLVACVGAQTGGPALLRALAVDALERGHGGWLLRHVDTALAQRWVLLAGAQGFMPTVAPQPVGGVGVWRNPDAPEVPQEKRDLQNLPDWLRAVVRAGKHRGAGPEAATASPSALVGVASPSRAHAPGWPVDAPEPGAAASMACVEPDPWMATPLRGAHRAPAYVSAALPHGSDIDDGVATQAGGLWFLLPLLERLGFADWQALHADTAVLVLILRRVLRHLRVPLEDPAWAWVDSLPGANHSEPGPWSTPSCWRDPAVRLDHDPAVALTPLSMARRWLIAVRRQLRHDAGLSMADVCRRPARLRWDRTHVDVGFALHATDLRVRRLGLDIDPGWVAWLGRVVVFVYGSPLGEGT